MSIKTVLDTARGELGYTENPPGSNKCKYNTAYYNKEVSGPYYPWCVTFLWWVFREAGERMAFFGGGDTASCGNLLRWYQVQGLSVPKSDVQPGDIVILNFSGTQATQHCGLVVGITNRGRIETIEGNTSPGLEGSQDNGGSVALKVRYPSQIVGVCRPEYKEDDMAKKTDYDGRWSEAAIRRCIERGIMSGYPDGTFKPTQTITREEAATVADNLVEYFMEVLRNNG
ncbi:MAG: S-layer homology domain-containing protein [Lachnospiraceae bacterium]|nr:S-layer homology domain-containing protein [Lachnospiraceae bacterium]